MPEVKFKIDNIDNLKRAFQQAPEIVAPFMRIASMKSAFLIENRSKVLSPVDTGRLRASIATSLGIQNKGITSIVSTNVDYAAAVHDGRKKGKRGGAMRGRPFMRQAVEQSLGDIEGYYKHAQTQAMQALANMAS